MTARRVACALGVLCVLGVVSSVSRASLGAQQAPPTAAPREVRLVPKVEIGKRFEFELVKLREDWTGEMLTRSTESSTPVDATYLAKLEPGWVCRWRFGPVEVSKVNGAESSEGVRRIADVLNGLELDLRLDEFGAVNGLMDEELVLNRMREAFAALERDLLAGVAPQSPEEKAARASIEQMRGALEGPSMLASTLREPTLFYALSGAQLELGVPRETQDTLPDPLGGEPFRSKLTFTLVAFARDGAEAVVEWRHAPEPEVVRQRVLDWARDYAKKAGQPPPKPEELPLIDVRDEGMFVFDVASGVPLQARWSRTTITGERRRVDGFRIEPRASKSR